MRVVIAGAGIAALEAAAALRDLAEDRVAITLVAPDREFVQRSVAPFSPFGLEAPPPVPVPGLAARLGADLATDSVAWVDRGDRTVHCSSGEAIAFDALVVGVGARERARFPDALTVGDGVSDELHCLIADVIAGRARQIVLVAPKR